MKNKKMILLLILLVGVIFYTTSMISAWLTSTDKTNPIELTVGKVKYQWSGKTTSNVPIVPGQELIEEAFKLKNDSNIKTQLRFEITVEYSNDGSVWNDITNQSNMFVLTIDSMWIKEDEHYYYNGKEGIIDALDQMIDVLTSFNLNGAVIGNAYSNQLFRITLEFEAKQAEYVSWDQLGIANIDFNTGLGA